jgi:hypothetical protein
MLDDTPPNRPCDDGSHRVLTVTFPYAAAQVVRARLIRLLGANRVSQLRRVDEGWELIICRRCIEERHDERLAG